MGIIVTKVRIMLKFLRKPSSPDPGSKSANSKDSGSGSTTPVVESKMSIFCKNYAIFYALGSTFTELTLL